MASSPPPALPDLLSFIPPRALNTAQTTSTSLDNLLDPPLTLHEDVRDGCGGRVWEAGVALAKFLIRNPGLIGGGGGQEVGDIIDLGSGSGLVGLAVAQHLARRRRALLPSSSPPTRILLTDLPALLPLMERNIALNPLAATSSVHVSAAVLDWSLPLPDAVTRLLGQDEAYHQHAGAVGEERALTVLAADCVYYEPAFPDLLDTLERLLGGGGERRCWFCMKRRRKADRRFLGALGKRFWVREWGLDEEMGKGVRLWEIRRKGWVEKGSKGEVVG